MPFESRSTVLLIERYVDSDTWWRDWTTWRGMCLAMVQVNACYVGKSLDCLVPLHLNVKNVQR